MRFGTCQLVLLFALGTVPFIGCAESGNAPSAAVDDESSEIASAMAELSPEDRAAAEKQETCPVGGGPLGSMGAPFKVTVEGRDVFLCCEGCKESMLENPDKYLAKLGE